MDKIQIGLLIFPRMTQLDMTGPFGVCPNPEYNGPFDLEAH